MHLIQTVIKLDQSSYFSLSLYLIPFTKIIYLDAFPYSLTYSFNIISLILFINPFHYSVPLSLLLLILTSLTGSLAAQIGTQILSIALYKYLDQISESVGGERGVKAPFIKTSSLIQGFDPDRQQMRAIILYFPLSFPIMLILSYPLSFLLGLPLILSHILFLSFSLILSFNNGLYPVHLTFPLLNFISSGLRNGHSNMYCIMYCIWIR